MMWRKLYSSACVASVAWMAMATAGSAQTQTAQSAEGIGIADIIVTANRREESLQRSALSIQTATGDDLVRAGVSRAEDLTKVATGVQIGSGGAIPQIYIRGVGTYGVNNYAEGAVAMNLDGVYLSRGWVARGALFDLSRVEVLKGPQGTLYGRNASGGAINLITNRPKMDRAEGYVEAEAGNYNLVAVNAALNLPLSDLAAVRLAAHGLEHKGYNDDGYDDQGSRAVRAQLLVKPTSDLSLLVSAFHQSEDQKGLGAVISGRNDIDPRRGATDPFLANMVHSPVGDLTGFPVPMLNALSTPKTDGYRKITIYGISAELNWNLGPVQLTVVPAYVDGKHRDLFYFAGFSLADNEYSKQTSVEARLSYESAALKWVLGAYYFNENQGNLPGANMRVTDSGIGATVMTDYFHNARSYATFGQATYSLSDTFRLTAGLRYTHEKKRQDGTNVDYSFSGFGCDPTSPFDTFDPNAPVPTAACQAAPLHLGGEVSYNSVTWKGGFEYDAGPTSMIYGNASTGFKAGGLNQALNGASFLPEKLTAFELGTKNRFLDNKLQANLELFYYRYLNHQEPALASNGASGLAFSFRNAGKAHSYGALLDLQYRASAQDTLALSVQYNKAVYDVFSFDYPSGRVGPVATACKVNPPFFPTFPTVQNVDCSGRQMVRTPLWTANAGIEHVFPLGGGSELSARVDAQYSSSYFTAIDFLQDELQKSYATADATLTYTSSDKRFSLALWVRNLTDEDVFVSSFRSPYTLNALSAHSGRNDGLVMGNLAPPRTFGIRARVNFGS